MFDAASAPAPNTPATHAPERFAPLPLWREAGAVLIAICQLFGGPDKIAERHMLTRKAHRLLASWLRCAEAMLRRLLALEAAAYPAPPPPSPPRRPRVRVRKRMVFSAEAPEQWRVSFRCFVARTGARRTKRASARAVAPKVVSAWPLAERLEALIRAYNEPAAYAARLARRLHRAPARVDELMRAPPEAVHRVGLFEAVGESASEAWRPRFSSG